MNDQVMSILKAISAYRKMHNETPQMQLAPISFATDIMEANRRTLLQEAAEKQVQFNQVNNPVKTINDKETN